MGRYMIKNAVMAALLASSGAAFACAYSGCTPAWNLFGGNGACHSHAVIAPGNDTRINLYALVRDAAGQGLGGKIKPPPGYEAEAFGQTFLNWNELKQSMFPTDAQADWSSAGDARGQGLAAAAPVFDAAMAANKALPAAERSLLSAARARLLQTHNGPAEGEAVMPWPAGIASSAGKEYLGYLQAADAFYGKRWDEARQGFAGLGRAGDPWVAETAAYMLVRTELAAATAHSIDEYGFFQGVKSADKAAIARGQGALSAYLKAWPQGRYAASARGLERRALWLSADFGGLAQRYDQLLGTVPATSEEMVGLVQEIDNKLLFDSGNTSPRANGPLLLATIDLMQMRVADPADKDSDVKPGIDAATLAGQQAAFMRAPDLYSFVQANYAFYVAKDYARVLQLIPDDARRAAYSPLAFSRQVLRGQALAARGDRNEAGFWRELIGGAEAVWQRPTVELALAMNLERNGQLGAVFAKDSPITDRQTRAILLAHSAGPDLLRSAAQNAAAPQEERDEALFTLLYKQLSRGNYAGFAANRALVRGDAPMEGKYSFARYEALGLGVFAKGRVMEAGSACPALAATAQTLAADPRNLHAQLCLGEFWRLNGFDGFTALDTAPPAGELGGAVSGFPGVPNRRGAFYETAIADPRAGRADKAYALFRIVRCYAPSGYNSCGGADVPKAQRKAWFDRLHREFPKSVWAQKLRIYW